MAQADVFTLVEDLASYRSDDESLAEAPFERYYADVVYEMGLINESAVDASFVAVTVGTAEYAFPAAAVRLLTLLHNDTELRPTTVQMLDAAAMGWRLIREQPRSFLTEDQDTRTVRVFPTPDVSSDTIGVATPFSGNFPENALTFVYTDNVTDVLPWDELWVALEVASREFGRESDHYDTALSQTFHQLATIVKQLVGHDV